MGYTVRENYGDHNFLQSRGNAPVSVFTGLQSFGDQFEVSLQAKIACRNGHMYARRLMDYVYPDDSQVALRENPLRVADGGVVRLSLVHYNSVEEMERCIAALDTILA